MQCQFCKENGHEDGHDITAVRAMPQSSDEGKTVEMVACCDGHAAGWWEGADWDGRHLEFPLDRDVTELPAAPGISMDDLSRCPQCGGNADRGIDNCIPPSAYMCSICCAQEDAEKSVIPPDGYALIHEGPRQDGDMRWSSFDQRWTLVFSDSMSNRIEDLGFPCARKIA